MSSREVWAHLWITRCVDYLTVDDERQARFWLRDVPMLYASNFTKPRCSVVKHLGFGLPVRHSSEDGNLEVQEEETRIVAK